MKQKTQAKANGLPKSPTGIAGLDQITGGGLPTGRTSLVCGGAGCGKTMLALEFLLCGALKYDEPGVFMMFEETPDELTANIRSLGFDLDRLRRDKKLVVDHVHVERSEIEETGEYDLQALFIRLDHAIRSVGAKRVVIDTLEALFAGLPNEALLRAELRRLFRWLKDRGVTAIITGERGERGLTRYGLEEYVADCVLVLDHRVHDEISTRRLRVVKYRGSAHGTNEYPFLIGPKGLSVLPITSVALDHKASTQRVASGIEGLDAMLGGKGVYRGSAVLVSGSSGTGKSTIAASFAAAACKRGERCLMFVYEESAAQVTRNMGTIGLDLQAFCDQGLLRIHASRPTLYGLEQHLLEVHDAVKDFEPKLVVIDPISDFAVAASEHAIKPMLIRLVDFLKQRQITAVFTEISTPGPHDPLLGVSSLMDTWLLLNNVEANGERTRTMQLVKSRGMPHSNQVREFEIGRKGVALLDAYYAGDQALTGRPRATRQAADAEAAKPPRRRKGPR